MSFTHCGVIRLMLKYQLVEPVPVHTVNPLFFIFWTVSSSNLLSK